MIKNYKKLRYGGIAVALTAVIVAVVVLLNVIITSLASRFFWYIDMTPNAIYSLTDECLNAVNNGVLGYTDEKTGEHIDGINDKRRAENEKNGLSEGDEGYQKPVSVTIYFCADPDVLMGNTAQRYIYETALNLADKCDFIKIEYLNWKYNPSLVEKYRATGSHINSYTVIIDADNYYTEGNNWMAYSQAKFFAVDSSGNTIGYNGERIFASGILSVSSAESPIAYITTNHSEVYYDYALLNYLTYSGYKIQEIDLSDKNFEFSEEGRLLVIYNPQSDFLASSSDAAVDEIAKMDAFLNKSNSLMVFMGPSSPVLPNLEEYLETWGIVFQRHTDSEDNKYSYMIKDSATSLTADGFAIKGDYVKTGGLGYHIYENLLENGYAPSVIFDNAMSIAYSGTYTEKRFESTTDTSLDHTYGYSYLDGVERRIYDVFTAPLSSVAIANGNAVNPDESVNKSVKDVDGALYTLVQTENGYAISDKNGTTLTADGNGYYTTAAGTKLALVDVKGSMSISVVSTGAGAAAESPFKLMTMSVKVNSAVSDSTGQLDPQNSYVLCCGSLEFATQKYLESAVYGNSDVLLSASTIMGREIVSVGIDFKYFQSYDISDLSESEANQYTLLLTILPPVIVFGVGIAVLVRRKYS